MPRPPCATNRNHWILRNIGFLGKEILRMTLRRRTGQGRRPAVRGAAGLTRETIVAAALRDIDENGLESFSLRRLAARLGVYPTALTWHVAGRSALLADVVARVLGDLIPRRFPDSWQGSLGVPFRAFRDAIRRHPNVAPLIGTQLVSNAGMDFEFIERLLGALSHAGLAGTRLAAGYNAVIAAMVGFSTMEFAAEPAEGKDEWQREMSGRLRDVSAARYPVLAANVD